MPESHIDGTEAKVETDKPKEYFSSKAARYSLIAPTICWLVMVLATLLKWDLYSMAWILEILFLVVAFSSLCAGFVALGAPKKFDVFTGVVGILLSGCFCFYDFLAVTVRV